MASAVADSLYYVLDKFGRTIASGKSLDVITRLAERIAEAGALVYVATQGEFPDAESRPVADFLLENLDA